MTGILTISTPFLVRTNFYAYLGARVMEGLFEVRYNFSTTLSTFAIKERVKLTIALLMGLHFRDLQKLAQENFLQDGHQKKKELDSFYSQKSEPHLEQPLVTLCPVF